jgi:hypothetical protein
VSERIVVAFKTTLNGVSGRLAERAKGLMERASALSGELIAFGATELAFAFAPDALDRALALAKIACDEDKLEEGEVRFSAAIAQGDVSPIAPPFSWGAALVVASGLAAATSPGAVTVSEGLKAFRQGELLTSGTLTSRTTGVKLRGARLDAAHPLRREAAGKLARVHAPEKMFGVEDPSSLLWPGDLSILRADPGLGGTRYLMELARGEGRARALFVTPSGSGLEPFGALRRAVVRSDDVNPFLLELAPAVERLTMGDGITLEEAARIVAAFLWPKSSADRPAPLLVDDAADVDEASLFACAKAAASAERQFPFVIRLDATGTTPRACSALAPGPEAELLPLPSGDAASLCEACLEGAVDPAVTKRWSRLGGNTPLGVMEALCHGIAAGEIVWGDGERAVPRRRTSGKGKIRPASQWIALRAMDVSLTSRTTLAVVAILGGEAPVSRIERILARADAGIASPRMAIDELVRARFLSEVREGYVSLPSRTHRDALGDVIEEAQRKTLHRVISDLLEAEEGRLARAEAAHHAARAGDGARAAKLAMAAARAAGDLGLEASAVRLLGFAREQDPSVQTETRARVASSIPPRAPSAPPAPSPAGEGQAVSRPVGGPTSAPSSRTMIDLRIPDMSAGQTQFSPPPPESAEPFTVENPVNAPIDLIPVAALERGTPADSEELKAAAAAPPPSSRTDSEPPTVARTNLAPFVGFPSLPGATNTIATNTIPSAATSNVPPPSGGNSPTIFESAPPKEGLPAQSEGDKLLADRLTELAKEALLGADTAALERWVDNLGATGEHAMLADRMRAMARLSRGEIGDALRVLKRARASLPKEAAVLRCQTSLALGMALAVAGRTEEALLEGLDALSRAKQGADARGTSACLAFLAKLYASVDRPADAERLRAGTPAAMAQ